MHIFQESLVNGLNRSERTAKGFFMHQGQHKLNHNNSNIYMKKFLQSDWLREVQHRAEKRQLNAKTGNAKIGSN